MSAPLLEVCVADAESLLAAVEGGADRIELCSALELGGLTPSPGLMRLAARVSIPVYAMVRARAGDFVFDQGDLDTMRADIDAIRQAGLAGVVLGASRANGELDTSMLESLLLQAQGLGSTLHRAFDLVPDLAEAVEIAASLGFERILTSGGAVTAIAGQHGLLAAHATARGRIGIMAGVGLTPENVKDLLSAVPLGEVHSSCSQPYPSQGQDAIRLGFATASRRKTSASVVRAFRRALSA